MAVEDETAILKRKNRVLVLSLKSLASFTSPQQQQLPKFLICGYLYNGANFRTFIHQSDSVKFQTGVVSVKKFFSRVECGQIVPARSKPALQNLMCLLCIIWLIRSSNRSYVLRHIRSTSFCSSCLFNIQRTIQPHCNF